MDVHCSTWSFLQDFFFQNMFDIGLTTVYLIEKIIKQTWQFSLGPHLRWKATSSV